MTTLAKELGCSVTPVQRILTEAGVEIVRRRATDYMSPDEVGRTREIYDLWQAGGSCKSIAADTGMKYDEVRARLIAAQVGRADISVELRCLHSFGEPGPPGLWDTARAARARADLARHRQELAATARQRAVAAAIERHLQQQ